MAFNPTPKQLTIVKVVVFLLALLPITRIALATGEQTNPLEFLTHGTGDWALYLLCTTLAVTPLRKLTGLNWLVRLRRMLGLFTFFYAFLHFTCFIWFDHFFDLHEIWKDVLKRPFITVGFAAFLLLVPLAATSSNAMVRRLGGKRWQGLHRMIYLIAPLAVLHYWWMKAGKHNTGTPMLFAFIVAGLLLIRVFLNRSKVQAARV
ncbi:protein-methionine-sulfoxide reductase heme-binding subunit MsrQ [Massilia terrae]|uniref:Protein-methionine-sulfoxide reductase heme-binding subunit MsrQ n=1 Tax=Massilia terrae TaxID=1811224 RepID=A0ABT2CXH3_9BURK|nr:protein-methionine-sulfoxide reductase heme-binding subunit MsrQ [Massilia terrae]MCS0658679.1 sulfoxide reductase heme-binding subunit YedZ [Massilia terrae]